MRDLAARLTALDPDAGAALRVITYFDRLTSARAGLPAIVRGAAVLAGCPAHFSDPARRIHLHVTPDGTSHPTPAPGLTSAPQLTPGPQLTPASGLTFARPDKSEISDLSTQEAGAPPSANTAGAGLSVQVGAGPSVQVGDGATLSLERSGPPGPVDAMILERAAVAAQAALDRTRRRTAPTDAELITITVDAATPEPERLQAASRLGFRSPSRVRAIALPTTNPAIHAAPDPAIRAEPTPGIRAELGADTGPPTRAGVGPAGRIADLPASFAAARTALRFTAEGTEQDPGPRIVHAEHLGGLALLADATHPGTEPIPDVRAVDRVAATAPWALATLTAVADSPSLRAAATTLRLHHSTLQERLTHLLPTLGWDPHDPHGRLRLQLALALRRLHRSTLAPAPPLARSTPTADPTLAGPAPAGNAPARDAPAGNAAR
ncbi:helix-turn-helix domain-containing protein [Actinoplanes sp. NPDC051851]|uniref:helix-turn-helix domain-containing protein n=1 Tax=Actinoplanes sp. NPDC051851 TaxID=3154753 RepID=UPI003449D3B4